MASNIIGKYKSNGSRVNFYVITKTKGFKSFCCKRDAEIARCYQVILADKGYAPKVYSDVGRITLSSGKRSEWGYITQRAKILNSKCDCCDCEYCDEMLEEYQDDIEYLCSEVYNETGLRLGDTHLGNFGIIKDKLVAIDTGEESFNGEYV